MDFEEMMKAMEREVKTASLKPISVDALPKGFSPIPDLKPGEKVRAKSEKYNNYVSAKDGAVLTVFRVGSFDEMNSGSQVYENDFTVLFEREDAIAEFSFDSRRFERITE